MERKLIECIDIKNPLNGHYVIEISKDIVFEYVIKDNDNNIYLLQWNSGDHGSNGFLHKQSYDSYQYKGSLFDLISLEILKMNQQEAPLPFTPMYLKQLTLKFYPTCDKSSNQLALSTIIERNSCC